MPTYHFDIVHEDIAGSDCRDHVAARRKADCLARQLAEEHHADRCAVVVTDPKGRPIYKAPIASEGSETPSPVKDPAS